MQNGPILASVAWRSSHFRRRKAAKSELPKEWGESTRGDRQPPNPLFTGKISERNYSQFVYLTGIISTDRKWKSVKIGWENDKLTWSKTDPETTKSLGKNQHWNWSLMAEISASKKKKYSSEENQRNKPLTIIVGFVVVFLKFSLEKIIARRKIFSSRQKERNVLTRRWPRFVVLLE